MLRRKKEPEVPPPQPFEDCPSVRVEIQGKRQSEYTRFVKVIARFEGCARTDVGFIDFPEVTTQSSYAEYQSTHAIAADEARGQVGRIMVADTCKGCPYVGMTSQEAELQAADDSIAHAKEMADRKSAHAEHQLRGVVADLALEEIEGSDMTLDRALSLLEEIRKED